MSITVPYSDDLERAVIVGVLSDPKIIARLGPKISSQDFYRHNHQEIYKVIESIDPEKLDSLTVEDHLADDAIKTYFNELVQDSERLLPSLGNLLYYAETIRDKSKLRAGIHLGQEITALCFQPNADTDEVLENLEQLFSKFIRERIVDSKNETTSEAFASFVAGLGTLRTNDGTTTGFYDLDLMLHQLEGLIIIAARPGVSTMKIKQHAKKK